MRRLAAVCILLASVAGCQQRSVLPDAEADAFAAQVEESVANSLTGLGVGSYEQHTRDFDEELLDRVDPVSFPLIVDETIGRLGAYQSHRMMEVFDSGTLRTVVYEVSFENDPAATVRVVFRRTDPDHHITGIWIESPLLASD